MKVLFQKTNFMMLQVTDYMIITEMLQLSIADKNILKTVYSVENDDRPIRTNTVFDWRKHLRDSDKSNIHLK